jgi:capsular polysaccharide export protein
MDRGKRARVGSIVVSHPVRNFLEDEGNLQSLVGCGRGQAVDYAPSLKPLGAACRRPFLRVPPFPGARVHAFRPSDCPQAPDPGLVGDVRRLRVGGAFWGAQPELPADFVLVRSREALPAAAALFCDRQIVLWSERSEAVAPPRAIVITGECDPWHVLSSAAAVVIDEDDELRVIAAILGVACYVRENATSRLNRCEAGAATLLEDALSRVSLENPFTLEPMTLRECVELCGFWRRLIDSNRDLAGGMGFAFWKQEHVAPLLWAGSAPFEFLRSARDVRSPAKIAVWRAKASPSALAEIERREIALVEIEDGFLRSRGLGADCIPPLSITVDRLGVHFDPSRPSELEDLLEHGTYDPQLLDRAADLRQLIVNAGLGKYERGISTLDRPAGERRHILVPGQVEDDRAVRCGGCGLVSNLELLKRVREHAPDAHIIYKPHPDVLAGHRPGAIPVRLCLQYADEVVSDASIVSLISMTDEVHVNTSLAGFEALLRGKRVTTYGVPFYAGWGLTHDVGPVPVRRTAQRTVEELVAATLLLYPRYLDPVTGLPCPAEIVVARLSGDDTDDHRMIVGLRRLQGKLMRSLRSLAQ